MNEIKSFYKKNILNSKFLPVNQFVSNWQLNFDLTKVENLSAFINNRLVENFDFNFGAFAKLSF